ncbi:MAG: hypothetical protein EBV03_06085 [Proteobacteria bacterium]|nr:hypothetical protein [Pseudomonadota bacterium]
MSVWILQQPENATAQPYVQLPYEGLPDLSEVASPAQAMKLLRLLHPGEPPETLSRKFEGFWHSFTTLAPDDVIAVVMGNNVALAEVTGRYEYRVGEGGGDLHLMPVTWHETQPRSSYKKFAYMFEGKAPLREIHDRDERIAILERLPRAYNRFRGFKWILQFFLVLSLLQLLRGLTGIGQ